MRRAFLLAVPLLAGWAMHGFAQQAHPSPASTAGLLGVSSPHGHARPVPANAPNLPNVFEDARSLGSPLILDKNWRVGVTEDPAAAMPDFDDSTWDLRNAQSAIADVADEDRRAGNAGSERMDSSENLPAGRKRPYAWFRIHLKLAPHHGPVSLLIELPITQNTNMTLGASGPGLDVFANGRRILPEGPHGDATFRYE